jgi:hypothetical protein
MSSPEQKMEKLVEALRKAEERRNIFVPPAVDGAILKAAREHLTKEPQGRPFGFWNWFALGTATALIALTILLLPRMKTPVFAREDINRDGQVDILDAMALAKSLDGAAVRFDQNGDGKVDDADVNAVAVAAVRMDRKS